MELYTVDELNWDNIDDLSNPEHVQGLTYGYLSIK
jgi:hypothetical protein